MIGESPMATFIYERQLWQQGFGVVAGVDEVGRGAWAGPLVAAAAVFYPQILKHTEIMAELANLRDSKKLSPVKRQYFVSFFAELAQAGFFAHSVGLVKPELIDRCGLTSATGRAMRAALRGLPRPIDLTSHVLVDAFSIRYLAKRRHTPIEKGDEKSISIAAASVIAKEYRDNLMRKYAKRKSFSVYGWETNVGYGTRAHQEAIHKYGLTKLHRRLFVRKFLERVRV